MTECENIHHKNVCCECSQCADCDDSCTVENLFESESVPDGLESAVRWHTDNDLICKECLAKILKKIESEAIQAVLDNRTAVADTEELSGESYTIEKWVK